MEFFRFFLLGPAILRPRRGQPRRNAAPALREFSERLAAPWHRLQKRYRLK